MSVVTCEGCSKHIDTDFEFELASDGQGGFWCHDCFETNRTLEKRLHCIVGDDGVWSHDQIATLKEFASEISEAFARAYMAREISKVGSDRETTPQKDRRNYALQKLGLDCTDQHKAGPGVSVRIVQDEFMHTTDPPLDKHDPDNSWIRRDHERLGLDFTGEYIDGEPKR